MADRHADILASAAWRCRSCPPGQWETPQRLPSDTDRGWLPASVPGTAAGALRAGGSEYDGRDFDAEDWWFRAVVPVPQPVSGRWLLDIGGIATVCDVWLNGQHVLHSDSMFAAHRITVGLDGGEAEVVIRCHALAPLLAERRPRARWRTRLVAEPNLRWFRTALLGRIPGWAPGPAPVGPWRPLRLMPEPAVSVERLSTSCDGDDGILAATLRFAPYPSDRVVTVHAAGGHATMTVPASETPVDMTATARAAGVQRWWPHSHGDPVTFPVTVDVDGMSRDVGNVGFRDVAVDRTGGGFSLRINGISVFVRGACWFPPDIVSLTAPDDEIRRTLRLLRDAGFNLVRIPGTTVYPDGGFLQACDELGMLVWQDLMFANLDPPDDDAFTTSVLAEVTQLAELTAGHPSLSVVCGGSEVEQQAAMFGLPAERRRMPLLEEAVPQALRVHLPGVPYVVNSPSGGALPFRVDTGVAHYFGVGAYDRPLSDARTSGVRFASECLAFSIPPEAVSVDEWFGGAATAAQSAEWKRRVPRDSGTDWDFEDVRDRWVRRLLEADPAAVRETDPEHAMDLGRVAVLEAMVATFTEWRRPGSSCAGGITIAARDLYPGAGWGLIDAAGRPKAPLWPLRHVLAPVAVLVVDEGLNGLRLHVVNDTASDVGGRLDVDVFAGDHRVEDGGVDVVVPARGHVTVDAELLLGGFRDLTWAYRFGPPAFDVVAARLVVAGDVAARAVWAAPHARALTGDDSQLTATGGRRDGDGWSVHVAARSHARYVVVDVPGYHPDDSWFSLPPGGAVDVLLTADDAAPPPAGTVRAVGGATVPITF